MRIWCVVMLASACGSHALVAGDAGTGGDAGNGGDAGSGGDAGGAGPVIGSVDPMCPVLGAPGDVTVVPPAVADSLTIVVSDNTGATLSRMDDVATSGPATVSVPACGMLTVVRRMGSASDVVTWTGVQPGDDLVDPRSVATAIVAPTVRAPSASGEAMYTVYVGCVGAVASVDATNSPATLYADPIQCRASDSVVDAVLAVTDGSASEYAMATAPISGGNAALTFGALAPPPARVHVDVSGTLAIAIIGIATDLVPLPGLDVPYAWTAGNVDTDDVSVDIDAGSGAGTLVITTDSADFGQVTASTLVRAYDALPASVALDASDLLPPITYTPGYGAGRMAIGLSTPTPVTGSLTIGTISLDISSGSTESTWQIVAPAGAPDLYFPAMPADLVPALDAEHNAVLAIDVYDDPDLPTYATGRAHLDELPVGTPTTAMRIAHTYTNDTLP